MQPVRWWLPRLRGMRLNGEAGPIPARVDRRISMWGLCAAAFFVLHAVLAWVLRSPGVTPGQDDAHYLILAESLGDFQYRNDFRSTAAVVSSWWKRFLHARTSSLCEKAAGRRRRMHERP